MSLFLSLTYIFCGVGLTYGRVVPGSGGVVTGQAVANNNNPWSNFQLPDEVDENDLPFLENALSAQLQQAQAIQGMGAEEVVPVEEQNGSEDDEEQQLSFVLQLPPNIGPVPGLAMDAQNRLVLFHRAGRIWDEFTFNERNQLNRSLGVLQKATIAVLDGQTGKVLEEHGKGQFYMPHGLTIDQHGNMWLTDVGTHQVHKLDKNFRPVLTLGEKMVPGSDAKHFCKPTDVAVASTGEFFVADGYCNSRIMKFDHEGRLLSQFGHPNTDQPAKNGEFFVPHSLALIEDLNLLCVADRENERIQCFSAGLEGNAKNQHRRAYVPTGTFFTKAENIGRVYAIREKDHFLVGVTDRDRSGQLEPQLFVMDMNSGRANSFAKGLENAHAVALSNTGDIFVSQMEPNQIVKFSLSDEGNVEKK